MGRINTLDGLLGVLDAYNMKLDDRQKDWFRMSREPGAEFLPFQSTSSYLETALNAGETDRRAMLRQIIPDAREFEKLEFELSDPLGENKFSPCPGLVHRYPDRALILLTDRCDMYCRHCFRRSFSGGQKGPLGEEALDRIVGYISGHNELKEVLISGGDPLTVSDRILTALVRRLYEARPELVIRICTRMPVVNPGRITAKLVSSLSLYDGIWFVTHFNHPAELTAESCAALKRLVKGGIPVLNQTVLLGGVNDSMDTLKLLFQKLVQKGVKPYYIFQGDLAAGTSHLRVPLPRALELTRSLKNEISGMAMPRFAVDLPGGGGKITLPSQSEPVRREGDFYIIKGSDNEEYRYPAY